MGNRSTSCGSPHVMSVFGFNKPGSEGEALFTQSKVENGWEALVSLLQLRADTTV